MGQGADGDEIYSKKREGIDCHLALDMCLLACLFHECASDDMRDLMILDQVVSLPI